MRGMNIVQCYFTVGVFQGINIPSCFEWVDSDIQ